MKSTLLTSAAFLSVLSGWAQFCGSSGPSFCVPGNNLVSPTFLDNIPCIEQGANTNLVIPIKIFNNIYFQGQFVTIISITIDSIENLPSGLCWTTNKVPNNLNTITFQAGEEGCIVINGVSYEPVGQYKLRVVLSAVLGLQYQTITVIDYLPVFVRLIDPLTKICPPVNMNQNVPFVPFDSNSTLHAHIRGRVYFDNDNNGIYQQNIDFPISNEVIETGNGYYAITGPSGIYNFYLPAGSYNLSPILHSTSSLMGYSPFQQHVNANSNGVLYDGNDFAVKYDTTKCNREIIITEGAPPPRPGFNNTIHVNVINNTPYFPLSGQLVVQYPPDQMFLNSSAPFASSDTSLHTITYELSNIPLGGFYTQLNFYTPPTTNLGTKFSYIASFHDSVCVLNNITNHTHTTTVVGSYDPNDKIVYPTGSGDNHTIPADTILHYTIRFQNTGTFYAENVIIIDTISSHLDLRTLRVRSYSHPYEVVVENSQTVKFVFQNIMLPDSFSDEPNSHGYIQYSIKPYQNLANGTVITNRADIYFDFNPPVLTNTVFNTIQNPVMFASPVYQDARVDVFPNPNQDGVWRVRCDASMLNQKLCVLDLSGRELYGTTIHHTEFTLLLPELGAGVYMIRVRETAKRLVKQ